MKNHRIGSILFNSPLMVHPGKLHAILAGMGHRFFDQPLPAELLEALNVPIGTDIGNRKLQAKLSEKGARQAGRYTVVDDGIAVVTIEGALTHKPMGMGPNSTTLQSYLEISEDLMDVGTDPSVAAILLNVDSPGGDSAGCFDLMDLIAEVAATKPVYAVANENAFSAAYAAIAPAARIYVPRTGGVGSVGVIGMHVDESAALAKEGMKITVVRGGKYKAELNSVEPLTKHALDSLQAEIDRRYALFADGVAAHRSGMDVKAVRATEAQTYFGPQAIAIGLADVEGTFADALRDLKALVAGDETHLKSIDLITGSPSTDKSSLRGAAALHAGPHKEKLMETENTAAPQSADVIDLNTARSEGAAEAANRAKGIVAACNLAGRPEAIADLLASELSVEQVMKSLLTDRAAADEAIALDSAAADKIESAVPQSPKAQINTSEIYSRRNKLNAGLR